jgi:hypothetical protein
VLTTQKQQYMQIQCKAFRLPISIFICCLLFSHCTADQLPEPQPLEGCEDLMITYESAIISIIENSCAYSGCHLDSAPGTYDDYEGLLGILNNGSFMERVITLRDDPNLGMPPDYAPIDRPRNLTTEEIQIIRCWLEAGYPQ